MSNEDNGSGAVLGWNSNDPITRFRGDHAHVMHSLVRAMRAAQNWHDIQACADVMRDVDVKAHYHVKELEHLSSDRAGVGCLAATAAQQEVKA